MPQPSRKNIALTGFMAVGKSAVGRALARKLKLRFVDLDKIVERAEGMKVREIFSRKGEAYFRQREKELLAGVLSQEGQVIATGGGVVMDEENLRLLKQRSLLVCLTASLNVIVKRAGNGTKRPLLEGNDRSERLGDLLKQRAGNYSQAHAFVDTSDLTIEQVADKIVDLLKTPS